MSGRRVLVVAPSETAELRLKLMLEAEGADIVLADGVAPAPGTVDWTVAMGSALARARALAPGVPVVEVAEDEDWETLRRRLAAMLAPPAIPSEGDALAEAWRHARILLVDDSVTYREFLRLELSRLGAQVVTCADAVKALAQIGGGGWDAVLIDLVMPGADGAQLCGQAARLRRDGDADFILAVLSSREGKADLMRSLEAGADMFLAKSEDMALIRVKMGAALRRRRLLVSPPVGSV